MISSTHVSYFLIQKEHVKQFKDHSTLVQGCTRKSFIFELPSLVTKGYVRNTKLSYIVGALSLYILSFKKELNRQHTNINAVSRECSSVTSIKNILLFYLSSKYLACLKYCKSLYSYLKEPFRNNLEHNF